MAGTIKGITIEIGGETTKLQSALKSAKDEGRETASEIGKINNALKFNPENLVLIAQKMDVLKDRVSAAQKELDTLKSVQEQVEKQFKDGDIGADEYRAFHREVEEAENKLENFKEQLKNTGKEFKEHSSVIGKVKDAYDDFKDKVEKLQKEHPKLTSAFKKSTDAAKTFANVGLKAVAGATAGSVIGITAVSAGVIKATEEMFEAAKVAAAAGDAIDEASQRMGVSAETFQELQYAAKMSGVEVQTLETAAKTLSKSGSNMDLSQAINQIASIKDESERTEKAIELFGSKAAYQMGPMLSQGAEGIQELKDKAQELGIVMSNEAVVASATFNDSLDNLTGTFTAVKNNLSAEFLPGLSQVMDGITGLLAGDKSAPMQIEKGVASIAIAFEEVTVGLSEKISPVFSAIAELFPTAFESIFSVIVQELPTFVEMGGKMLNSLASGLVDNSDSLITTAECLIEMLANGFGEEGTIGKLLAVGLTLISSIVASIGDNADMMVESAFEIVTTLIDGLLNDDNAAKLMKGSLDIVTAILTGLISNAPELIVGAAELIGVLVDEIIHYDWWQVAKDIFYGIIGGFESIAGDGADGSHAGGIGYVPYNGYNAELHEGERVLTAAQNRNYMLQQQEKTAAQETLSRRLDALETAVNKKTVNKIRVTAVGSARGIVRELKFYSDEEDIRQSAFDD